MWGIIASTTPADPRLVLFGFWGLNSGFRARWVGARMHEPHFHPFWSVRGLTSLPRAALAVIFMFMLSTTAGMTDACHSTQPFSVEKGSYELFYA
jgi:hypothetical protein